jgi:hypothetical protein
MEKAFLSHSMSQARFGNHESFVSDDYFLQRRRSLIVLMDNYEQHKQTAKIERSSEIRTIVEIVCANQC